MNAGGGPGAHTELSGVRMLVRDGHPVLDDLVRLLGRLCRVPFAAISLVESGGVVIPARHGFDDDTIGPDPGLCVTAVEFDGLYVVPDTLADPIARTNPLVTGPLAVRFYAAVPLTSPGGERFGNICIFDCEPSELDDTRAEAMTTVAQLVTEQLALLDRAGRLDVAHGRLADVATDRLRTDVELRETTGLLRVASRLGVLGGWSVDVPPANVVWSDEVCAIHDEPPGFSPTVEAAIGYYTPEYVDVITGAFTACVERGIPYDLEAEMVSAAGRRLWCRTIGEAYRDESGTIVRVGGAFQDITHFKQTEQALAESEERFRLVSLATSDVVFDWDLESDEIWHGEGLEEWVGPVNSPVLSIDAVAGRIHPDDVDRMLGGLRTALESSDEQFWTDRFRLIRHDGTDLLVEASGLVMRDPDGRARRLVGSLVDMTAQQQLEHRLAQSQRLEAIGQLTGGVAHDFNNLLTVILGNADLLLDDLDDHDDRDQRSLVEMVRMAAERGAALTRQLLAFARRQPLTPTVVDISGLLAGIHELLLRTLGEDVDIGVTHDPGLWPALVDGSQLEAALLNVCLNARDAMEDGGRLTIAVSNVELDHHSPDAPTDLEPGRYVMISVTDTGHGMAADVIERAFEPFFTTKATGRGNGLGLSMVYGFVKQSHGHAVISSEPDHGTTVRLYLPRAVSSPVSDTVAPATIVRPGGSEMVLLVEDDDLVRNVVAAQLSSLGYEVVEAYDGVSALRLLRDGLDPALLFTDVVMPGGLDGRQLADAAHEITPELPVLFTSGYSEDAIVHGGRLDAGLDLLPKPYRLDELATRVRRALGDVNGDVNGG